jgi:hypothetical protein
MMVDDITESVNIKITQNGYFHLLSLLANVQTPVEHISVHRLKEKNSFQHTDVHVL